MSAVPPLHHIRPTASAVTDRRYNACPRWMFPLAGASCEAFASVFGTKSPLTRDFIKIGMVSSVADTSRMKRELLPQLAYPTLKEGLALL